MAQAISESGPWKRRFFAIWVGQAFSLFGSSLVGFAMVWWLTESTRSATVLALATLVAMLPQVLLGPVAGTLVDRWNRRTVMIVADGCIALATLVLLLLFLTGAAQVWHVFAILAIRSVGGTFHYPAMQSSTSLMVPHKHLSRVAGANQALHGAMNIVAPPVGALLLALLSVPVILAIDVVTALLGIAPLLLFAIPQPARRRAEDGDAARPSVWHEMIEGLRYVRAWPGLMIVIGMAMLLNFLLTPAFSLLPILVTNHFGGMAPELAALNSTLGIGVVLGGIALGVWGGFRRRIMTSLAGIVGIGIGTLLIGVSPAGALWMAIAGMFIAGFMQPMANGPLQAVMQASVAPEMQGRVFTLLTSGAVAMSPLSLAVAGPIADAVGVQTWYVVAACACIGMGLLATATPALVNLERNNGAASEAAVEPQPAQAPVTEAADAPGR